MPELSPSLPSTEATPPLLDAENPGVRRKRRGDLWYFETSSVPRPDDVCARYVGLVAPWWGFAAYGFLYFFVAMVAFLAGMLLAIGVKEVLGFADGSTGAQVLAWVFSVAAFVLSWWPFARWVKRRRAAAYPLLREGELVDGIVVSNLAGRPMEVASRVAADFAVARVGGIRFYRVAVTHAGGRVLLKLPVTKTSAPAPDTKLTVLFKPQLKYALVFDLAGKAQVASVGR
jgi:hypothetical protein